MKDDNLPRFTLRVSPSLLNKIAHVAKLEGRTKNKQIEQILIKSIKDFEIKNGKIEIDN